MQVSAVLGDCKDGWLPIGQYLCIPSWQGQDGKENHQEEESMAFLRAAECGESMALNVSWLSKMHEWEVSQHLDLRHV